MSTVSQKVSVAFTGGPGLLTYYLNQLAGDIEYLSTQNTTVIQVFQTVKITLDADMAYIEWTANPVTDMYADAVLAVLLKAEKDPIPPKSELYILDIINEFFLVSITLSRIIMVSNYSNGKTK